MDKPGGLARLLKDQGVISFILVDRNGAVVIHDVENPEEAAKAIFLAARHLKAVGRHQFSHAVFPLVHGRTMLLYPLGDGILSVVTGKDPVGLLHVLETFSSVSRL